MRENDKAPGLSCAEVRAFDMVCYLEQIGIFASRVKGNDYWYLSPLRNEKTPSFKVNRLKNRWFDFGSGQGGNLLDFGILYYGCSISELLRSFGSVNLQPLQLPKAPLPEMAETKLTIHSVKTLQHQALTTYLEGRGIPHAIAVQYCREVYFKINDRTNFAIGFLNQSGGFELRNKFFKGSSSPKDYTIIRKGSDIVSVFEGFMDFLSFLVLFPDSPTDFLILNSLSLFNRARKVLDVYHAINLYLDNNTAGQNCSQSARSLGSGYNDQSHWYKDYEDLNDFLRGMRSGFAHHPRQKFKPP
jgi:hypothetical protein